MKRLLVLIPALLFSGAAFAQTAPDDAKKDLWCGTAFVMAFSNPPADATPEQIAQAKPYIDGGNMLIDRATASYKTAGFTDEQFSSAKADLAPVITEQIKGNGAKADYSFEDCTALLPPPPAAQ